MKIIVVQILIVVLSLQAVACYPLDKVLLPHRGFGYTNAFPGTFAAYGEYFYAGMGGALVIGHAASKKELDRIYLPGKIEDIDIDQSLMAIAASNLGLFVYDISDPANPEEKGRWRLYQGLVRSVALTERYAYCKVASEEGEEICTIDLRGLIQTGSYVSSAMIYGKVEASRSAVCYISLDLQWPAPIMRMTVLDRRAFPENPVFATTFAGQGRAAALEAQASNDQVYLALQHEYLGLCMMDLSDPFHPKVIDQMEGFSYAPADLCLSPAGDNIYVATQGAGTPGVRAGEVACFRIEDNMLHYVSKITEAQIGLVALAVTADGYVVAGGSNNTVEEELRIYSGLTRRSPVLHWKQDVPAWSEGIYVVGDYLYGAMGHDGLWIINIANPDQPFLVGKDDSGYWNRGSGHMNLAENLWLSDNGDYCHLAEGNWVSFYDTRDKTQPRVITCIDFGGWQEGIRQQGNMVYVFTQGGDKSAVVAVDVSSPLQPRELARLQVPGAPKDGFVDEKGFIYIAAASHLVICRMSSTRPHKIVPVASFNIQQMPGFERTEVWDCEKYGDYLFMSSKTDRESHVGLLVFDVSQPSLPVFVNRYPFKRGFEGLWLDGSFVYCSRRPHQSGILSSGVSVFDVSNPREPRYIDDLLMGDTVLNVHAKNGILYGAGFRGGIPMAKIQKERNRLDLEEKP